MLQAPETRVTQPTLCFSCKRKAPPRSRRFCVSVAQPDADRGVQPPRFGKIIQKLEKERQQSDTREDLQQSRQTSEGNKEQSDRSDDAQRSRQKGKLYRHLSSQ